jgi:two-component system sensor histidine kinase HydH
MFRVKDSEVASGSSLVERAVQVMLLVAVLASLGVVYFISQAYGHVAAWRKDHSSVPAVADSWQDAIRLQLVGTLVVVVLLLFCFAALWWLRRRFFHSQKSLRELKMLAHDILASMDRGVVTTDRQGSVTSINSAGIELLGVDFECVGRPLACICPADVSLGEVYRQVTEHQVAVRDRDFTLNRMGRALRLRVDGHVLKDTRGRALGCVIHIRDVTERILLEERMGRMERFISLATLASGLHHEIKNPLTALSIHIQLLEESLTTGPDGASVEELVGVLKTEVSRLNGVLENFRSFAHLQRLTLQPTDALGVVEDVVRLIRPQAAQQGVQILLLHPEKELPPVPLDAEKFEQVILNLAINALEAMPGGGSLTISVRVEGREFQVSVTDSGTGIPPDIQRNLFQPYFSTKNKGSGMGLALSEKLVGQHGGHIGYRTGPEGTCFNITIPMDQEAPANERS